MLPMKTLLQQQLIEAIREIMGLDPLYSGSLTKAQLDSRRKNIKKAKKAKKHNKIIQEESTDIIN